MPRFDRRTSAFLTGVHFAKLGTVNGDGSPHVTPMWYMYVGGKLIVNTTTDRVKFKIKGLVGRQISDANTPTETNHLLSKQRTLC